MSLLPSTQDSTPGDPMADYVNALKAWDRDTHDQYFVRFHDNPGPSKVMLAEEFYATDVDGVPGSWCNLMYGKVFFAMPTCPVMTIFRRADEPRSRRRSRGQDEEGRQYIGTSASSRASQDEDQDPCSGALILILMIPTLGP